MYSFRSVISLRSTSTRRNEYYTDVESSHSVSNGPRIYGQNDNAMKTMVVGGMDTETELQTLPRAGQIQVEHGILQTRGNAG